MQLTRWNPFREMDEFLYQFNRSVGRPTRGEGRQEIAVADWAPTVDISETETEYVIQAELPEVRKDDVKVTVHDGVLTIQGERKMEREETDTKKKYHRIERSHGSFARSFTLPENVDDNSVKARHRDGMLYLHLEKTEEAKPKSIEVKVA